MNPAAISARLAFLFFSSAVATSYCPSRGLFRIFRLRFIGACSSARFLNFLSLDSYESVLVSAVVPLTSKTLFARQLMAAAKSLPQDSSHRVYLRAILFPGFNQIISQSPLLPLLVYVFPPAFLRIGSFVCEHYIHLHVTNDNFLLKR